MGNLYSRSKELSSKSQKQTNHNYYEYPPAMKELPISMDLREVKHGCFPYPEVYQQEDLRTCSSIAAATAFECAQRYHTQQYNSLFTQDSEQLQWFVPSVLHNYYYARVKSGNAHADIGTSVESALSTMHSRGVAADHSWPYETNLVNIPPSKEAQSEARHQAVVNYKLLNPQLNNLLQTITNGHPIIFSFTVFTKMDRWFRNRNQQISSGFLLNHMQASLSSDNVIVGAHTILIVGYNSEYLNEGAFLCRNSWGESWGDTGHFWFSFQSALLPELQGVFYFINDVCVSKEASCTRQLSE